MVTLINNQNNESKSINGTYKSEDNRLYFRDYRKPGRAPGLVYLTNNHLHTTGEVDEVEGRYYVELDEGWSLQESKRTGSAAPMHTGTGTNLVADLRSNAQSLLRHVTNLQRVKDEAQQLQLTSDSTDEQFLDCLSLEQLRSVVRDNTPEQFQSLLANANRAQLMELAQSSSAYISKWSLWENADLETAKNRLASLIEVEEDVKKLCDTINGLSNAIYFQTEEAEAEAEAQAQAQADEAQAQADEAQAQADEAQAQADEAQAQADEAQADEVQAQADEAQADEAQAQAQAEQKPKKNQRKNNKKNSSK